MRMRGFVVGPEAQHRVEAFGQGVGQAVRAGPGTARRYRFGTGETLVFGSAVESSSALTSARMVPGWSWERTTKWVPELSLLKSR